MGSLKQKIGTAVVATAAFGLAAEALPTPEANLNAEPTLTQKLLGGRLAAPSRRPDIQQEYLATPVLPATKAEDTIRMCVESRTDAHDTHYDMSRPKKGAFPVGKDGFREATQLHVKAAPYLAKGAEKFIPSDHLIPFKCGNEDGYLYTTKKVDANSGPASMVHVVGNVTNGVLNSRNSRLTYKDQNRDWLPNYGDTSKASPKVETTRNPRGTWTTGLASWSEANTGNSGLSAKDHFTYAGAAAIETVRDIAGGLGKIAVYAVPGALQMFTGDVYGKYFNATSNGVSQLIQAPQDAFYAAAHAVRGAGKVFESNAPYEMEARLKAYNGPIPGVYGKHEGPLAPNMGELYYRQNGGKPDTKAFTLAAPAP